MKIFTILLLLINLALQAQNYSINDKSYFLGRDYFLLRSGNVKMVIQADKADVGAAFTYLLFDASTPKQSERKVRAFNYVPVNGFSSSALNVIMRDVVFSALGHNTVTNWVVVNGIPSVNSEWWASGVKVTEVITPVSLKGVFKRTITLVSADLVTDDTVSLQLSLPLPASIAKNNVLICHDSLVSMALIVGGNYPVTISSSRESLKIGPLPFKPGEKKVIESYLLYANINGKKINPDNKGEVIIPKNFASGKIQIFCK